MLDGWMSSCFKEWMKNASLKCNTTSEEVLIGTAETIRMISHETLRHLKKETPIPPFIITENLTGNLAIIKTLASSGSAPEIYCSEPLATSKINPFVLLISSGAGLMESLRVLQDGKRVVGGANEFATAYFSLSVQRAFDSALGLDKNTVSQNNFINTVIEETIHFFDHRHHPALMKKFSEISQARIKQMEAVKASQAEKDDMKQELEKEILNIKDRVAAISRMLALETEDLFSPFKKHCKLPLY